MEGLNWLWTIVVGAVAGFGFGGVGRESRGGQIVRSCFNYTLSV